MDKWVSSLRNSNVDIFEVINNAILVAAADHPDEFRAMRDSIAQTLFSRELNECQVINLSREIEKERILVSEVLKIKMILDNENKDDVFGSWVLYYSLWKLQQMVLSVKILKETMIGESVSPLQKHAFKHVSRLARMLIKEWRSVADEWVEVDEKKSALSQEEEKCSESVVSQPERLRKLRIKVKKAQLSSENDKAAKGPEEKVENNTNGTEDEVLRIKAVLEKNVGDESALVMCDLLKKLKHMDISIQILEKTGIGKTISVLRKHVFKDVSDIARTLVKAWRDMAEEWIKKDSKYVKPISEKATSPKSLVTHDQHCKPLDSKVAKRDDKKHISSTIEEKLKSVKRRLQENYNQVENMKKKRRIQVMELPELTKIRLLPQQQKHVKPVNKRVKM